MTRSILRANLGAPAYFLIQKLAPREATPDRTIVSSTRLCHVPQMRITNASWMKLQCGIFSGFLSRVQASCMWTCGFLPWSPLFFRFTCEYHNIAPGKPRGRWTQYKLPREEWLSRWADVKKPRDIFYLLNLGQSRVMSEIKTSSFSPECIQCWNSSLISHHDCASLGYLFACTTNIRYWGNQFRQELSNGYIFRNALVVHCLMKTSQ